MPKKVSMLLLITLICAGLFAQVDDEYAARKALMGDMNSTRAMIASQNSIVRVNMDDTDGQFVIGKVTGERLLYGYPSSPWSSWTCFYIDGVPTATISALVPTLPVLCNWPAAPLHIRSR
jgi:hypothetical protein